MKFVTVMDMWLLLINMVLLGCILYYGRRLIKSIEKVVNKESDQIKEEREWFFRLLKHEEENISHQISMVDPRTPEWSNLNDHKHMIKDLEEKVLKRQRNV